MVKEKLVESLLIESLANYMRKLRGEEEHALVVVEGPRDALALKDSGYGGEIFTLCQNANVTKLEEAAGRYEKTILLLDSDEEGRKLSARTERILRGRVKLDTYYQRELLPASKGKIRHIEEFSAYAERLSRHV